MPRSLGVLQIREETDTRIDLPNEASDSDVILITGKKQNVEAAKVKIEAIQKELVSGETLCLLKIQLLAISSMLLLYIYI